MALENLYPDLVTITFSYILFWTVIIFLILYPKLRLKRILKRIKNLEQNLK